MFHKTTVSVHLFDKCYWFFSGDNANSISLMKPEKNSRGKPGRAWGGVGGSPGAHLALCSFEQHPGLGWDSLAADRTGTPRRRGGHERGRGRAARRKLVAVASSH